MMKLNIADLKKRLNTATVVAVSIESRRIAVDILRREEWGSAPVGGFVLPVGGDAIISDAEKVGKQLAAELLAAGVRERRCVVCLPPNWAVTTSTDVPAMSDEDLRGYLELRAEREFPMALSELRLSHCAFNLPGGNQRATLAAVPAKRLDAINRMLATAGCKAVSISLGLSRCLQVTQPAALHLLANCNHVDVVVTAGGGVAALRSIEGVPPGDETFDAVTFCREVRITLGRLPEALRREVSEAHFGGVRGTAEALCGKTREHLGRMGVTPALDKREFEAAALETADRYLKQEPVPFEFIAKQTSRWQTFSGRFDKRMHRWLIAGAAALILLPILTFTVRSHIESNLEEEWNGMKRSVGELESLQQKIRQYRPWFEPTPQALRAMEGLISAFPDRGDVWAKNIQIAGSKVTCTGFARSQPALIEMLDRLRARPEVSEVQVQQMRGQNPVEFAFTYKQEVKS